MPFTFVYRAAYIYMRESAEISAVQYTNLNGIVSKKQGFILANKKITNMYV